MENIATKTFWKIQSNVCPVFLSLMGCVWFIRWDWTRCSGPQDRLLLSDEVTTHSSAYCTVFMNTADQGQSWFMFLLSAWACHSMKHMLAVHKDCLKTAQIVQWISLAFEIKSKNKVYQALL